MTFVIIVTTVLTKTASITRWPEVTMTVVLRVTVASAADPDSPVQTTSGYLRVDSIIPDLTDTQEVTAAMVKCLLLPRPT